MLKLQSASREELVALLVAQHELLARQQAEITTLTTTVAQLTARVAALLAALDTATRGGDDSSGSGPPTRMPGLKPASTRPRPPKTPRKRRTQAFVRRRMAPTAVMTHARDVCPTCGTPLAGGSLTRTREVIEVPLMPATITHHHYLERRCPCCHTRHTPRVALGEAVVGKQRFGVGLVSLIATLREAGQWPIARIQWYLATVHGLHLSGGAIVAAGQQVATAGAGAVAAVQAEMRASPVVHLDETGWREAGVNGYVWTAATPRTRYFVRGSRGSAMVDALLGETFGGVVVSDFYVGYAPWPGVKQKCWAHLLRDVHELRVKYVKDAAVQAWAAAVQAVYGAAVAWTHAHPEARAPEREAARQAFARELQAVYAPFVDAAVPQRVLSARMAKHLHELFVFVVEPAVPPDNNLAERSLRPLVTSRKISGGTRSAAGSATKMALATLFGTWRLQGENPLTACRALLLSPHP